MTDLIPLRARTECGTYTETFQCKSKEEANALASQLKADGWAVMIDDGRMAAKKNGRNFSLADIKSAYEAHYGVSMPMDLPFATAAKYLRFERKNWFEFLCMFEDIRSGALVIGSQA